MLNILIGAIGSTIGGAIGGLLAGILMMISSHITLSIHTYYRVRTAMVKKNMSINGNDCNSIIQLIRLYRNEPSHESNPKIKYHELYERLDSIQDCPDWLYNAISINIPNISHISDVDNATISNAICPPFWTAFKYSNCIGYQNVSIKNLIANIFTA